MNSPKSQYMSRWTAKQVVMGIGALVVGVVLAVSGIGYWFLGAIFLSVTAFVFGTLIAVVGVLILTPDSGSGSRRYGMYTSTPEPGVIYMYDERAFDGIPSVDTATRILADIQADRAFLHPISDPGALDRLKDIIAGRNVDPSSWNTPAAEMNSQRK
ncbi:hypothetical protein RBA41_31185 [Massilia sp. CCM 9210]|uniref:hypothetical protein n=1 Tax=Massilia scottii TaxID=3057166 RepID=UPI0027965EC9|nr:hypothetical protein [Massilia sp. CCM 9210]MDQ1817774.1 hypothetical protein [Massilia sp. CCM 9210]